MIEVINKRCIQDGCNAHPDLIHRAEQKGSIL